MRSFDGKQFVFGELATAAREWWIQYRQQSTTSIKILCELTHNKYKHEFYRWSSTISRRWPLLARPTDPVNKFDNHSLKCKSTSFQTSLSFIIIYCLAISISSDQCRFTQTKTSTHPFVESNVQQQEQITNHLRQHCLIVNWIHAGVPISSRNNWYQVKKLEETINTFDATTSDQIPRNELISVINESNYRSHCNTLKDVYTNVNPAK